MVVGNKLASKSMNLSYVPPEIKEGEIVVHLLKEDLEAGKKSNAKISYYVW